MSPTPIPDEHLRWGDSHHPALSETDGKYDGRWLYINDRAHGRIGMVDLRDFRTKQVLHVPNLQTSHGGVFATPDTRYVHISSKVPALKGWDASKGQKITRRRITWITTPSSTAATRRSCGSIQKTGRMILKDSFQIELPPYTQDLADAGKGAELRLRLHQLLQRRDGDRRHRAGQAAARSRRLAARLRLPPHHQLEEGRGGGRGRQVHRAERHPRHLARDRHRRRAAASSRPSRAARTASTSRPSGDYITVSGKLDPHATVYGFDRIKKAIDEKNFEGKDRYGIPILKFDAVVAGKVDLGAGPLHTQYDNKGNAYTSLYLESAVAKWTLGEPYHPADKAFKLVDKVSIHYNIGHLATAQGDTMDPQGKYLVAMNKWSIDRHSNVGPLHPQNFQLIDISGEKMELLADMPIGFGEPHYAQMVKADILKAARGLRARRVAGLDGEEPRRASPARRRRASSGARASSRSG